ncbi:unnamed protein product [Ceratitis capitata]|uniref:(Mediterranean fruit fly) hypothetical protein n=1 Tax=Ceratitis capitata TaxID=7213 RepID=A0A811UI49_CERCA|nr:unnamed protein product [Ceratitis capitata]
MRIGKVGSLKISRDENKSTKITDLRPLYSSFIEAASTAFNTMTNVIKEILEYLGMALLLSHLRMLKKDSQHYLSSWTEDVKGNKTTSDLAVSLAKSTKAPTTLYSNGNAGLAAGDVVQYDIPKNSYKRANSNINYEQPNNKTANRKLFMFFCKPHYFVYASSVLGSGGIMYINGRIVSGPLDSLIDVLVPKNRIDFDKLLLLVKLEDFY